MHMDTLSTGAREASWDLSVVPEVLDLSDSPGALGSSLGAFLPLFLAGETQGKGQAS